MPDQGLKFSNHPATDEIGLKKISSLGGDLSNRFRPRQANLYGEGPFANQRSRSGEETGFFRD
jgi:hypothetical protein